MFKIIKQYEVSRSLRVGLVWLTLSLEDKIDQNLFCYHCILQVDYFSKIKNNLHFRVAKREKYILASF